MNDILCKCGHEKKHHKSVGTPIWDEYCNAGRRKNSNFEKSLVHGNHISICLCAKYQPDNLLHIETLAKKRKLI
jgi:hypothetical protein